MAINMVFFFARLQRLTIYTVVNCGIKTEKFHDSNHWKVLTEKESGKENKIRPLSSYLFGNRCAIYALSLYICVYRDLFFLLLLMRFSYECVRHSNLSTSLIVIFVILLLAYFSFSSCFSKIG